MPVLGLLQLLQPPAPGTLWCHAGDGGEPPPLQPLPQGGQWGAVAGPPDNKALKLPVEMRLWDGEEREVGGAASCQGEGMLPADS